VAEEDAISTAAGLAASGKIVFLSTFAIFAITLGLGQIRQNICLCNLEVKLVLSHGGITVGEDGASHQALEDIAVMRALPNMKVIVPADYYQVKAVIKKLPEIKGPVYVRLSRPSFPVIYDQNLSFSLGQSQIHLIGKKRPEITLIGCGLMVHQALQAAKVLWKKHQFSSRVINLATIKPLDKRSIFYAAKNSRIIFTLEEHSVIGGLGEAVASILSQLDFRPKLKIIGILDQFGQSGKPNRLLDHYGLSVPKIVKAILAEI
jgi:transketolase